MPHPMPPTIPRSGGPITRAIGRLAMWIMRWRIVGELPNLPKMVIIVAPHSSNWDFVVGLAAKFRLGLHARWLGKHTIFRGPAAAIFRSLGGIPVDRRSPHNVVDACVHAFERSEAMVLALAPEGTRKPGAEWRSGFWHIAKGAGVPILPVALDWQHRVIRIGHVVRAQGDAAEEVARIQEPFTAVRGRR